MKKFLSVITNGANKIKDTFRSLFTKNKKKNYATHSGGNKHKKASRQGVEATPVMGEPGGEKVRTAEAVRRTRSGAAPRRRGNVVVKVFWKVLDSFKAARLANKKRFAAVLGVVAAAVLVPVIAVSANSSVDHTTKAAEGDQTVQGGDALPDGKGLDVQGLSVVPAEGDGEVVEWQEELAAGGSEQEAEAEPEPQYLELEPESQHPDIIKLQQRLMDLYYMDNDEPTDYYGPMTQQAVGYFQRKHDLVVDGVAGVETQQLLFSDAAMVYSVTVGAEGADVSNIQDRLRELGYSCGLTGYFGEETVKAVEYFQRMNGLDADGSVGQYTKDILFSEQAEPSLEYGKKSSSSGGGGSSSGGGGGGSTTHVANPGSVSGFIEAAAQQLGKPYRTAGKGPDSFDCSGLVYYALQASGNGIGYMTSGGWANSGYPTVGSIAELQPGDIICFSGHVGVYVGGGTMIDASSGQGAVVQRGLGSWAYNNFICGKRPL
jgi:peptidoglycan hydrolase-like protein with peptidoglycan-binding domain